MTALRSVSLVFFALCLFTLSCRGLGVKNLNVEKLSPKSEYRVKVDAHVEDTDFYGGFHERARVEVFKAQEVIYKWEFENKDTWEDNFISTKPVIEWVGDNVLRMGGERPLYSASDQLLITNKTNESFKHMSVVCGKHESFEIFDVPPNSQFTLSLTPQLCLYGTKYSLGYGGETLSGKGFSGALQQEKASEMNSMQLEITVTSQVLKSKSSQDGETRPQI